MRASAKSVKITPPFGLPIGGNIRDDNIARGTHDDLYCNIILLEDYGNLACFLGFDLLGIHIDTCEAIKSKITARTGIQAENIIISCTHTHSGPDVVDFFKPGKIDACIDYLMNKADLICSEILTLLEDLIDVRLTYASKNVYGLSFNRRLLMRDGSIRMNWEGVDPDEVVSTTGPIDPELSVLSVNSSDGKPQALLINFTMHPAVLVGKDWLWSRDYINYLDAEIKKCLRKDMVVLFTNGAEGNINHFNYKNIGQDRGFSEAERVGTVLASEVLKALESARELTDASLHIKSNIISLPRRPISRVEVEKAERIIRDTGGVIPSLLDGVPDEIYAREIIKLEANSKPFEKTRIHAVRIGDVCIATLPGEVFVEFGLRIKQHSGYANTMVIGLANDCIGYIPNPEAFSEGGYEIKTASSSQFDISAGDVLTDGVLKLIKEL